MLSQLLSASVKDAVNSIIGTQMLMFYVKIESKEVQHGFITKYVEAWKRQELPEHEVLCEVMATVTSIRDVHYLKEKIIVQVGLKTDLKNAREFVLWCPLNL